jgi:hypothetical protein
MLAQTILIAIVLVTLLAGLFFNYKAASELKADIHRLDSKIDGVQAGLLAKIDAVQADLRQFYHLTGKLEGRLDAVERRIA